MELRKLTAFCEVARQLSFNRAATRLGYVQSTVSAQIRSLEQELGVQLFDRLGRTIALTTAGEALLPHALRILDLAEQAKSAVAGVSADNGEVVGSFSVSAPESLLTYRLPAVLTEYHELHPRVSIDLRPTPVGRFRGETRRAVAAGEIHLAFVLDTPLHIPGFVSEILIQEPISVIISPKHQLAAAHTAGPSDFDGETLLLPEAPDSGCVYRGQFERQLADKHVTAETFLEFTSIETVKQCVASGMGVSALLSVAVDIDVAVGRLARLPWSEPFDAYTQMIWNARRSVSPAVSAFMATARGTLQGGHR